MYSVTGSESGSTGISKAATLFIESLAQQTNYQTSNFITQADIEGITGQLVTIDANFEGLDVAVQALEAQVGSANITEMQSVLSGVYDLTLEQETAITAIDVELSSHATTLSNHAYSIGNIQYNQTQDETHITTLQTQMTSADSWLASLQSQANSTQSNVTGVIGQVNTLITNAGVDETNIAILQGQMTTANSNISTLQSTALTSTSPAFTSLQYQSLNNGTAILNLQGSGYHATSYNTAMQLAADVQTLYADITTIQTNQSADEAAITSHTSSIATNTTNIATNTSSITSLNTSVAALQAAVTGPPIGSIHVWPKTTAPTNYLLCNGAGYNTTTYAALYAVLGTSTVPDFRGYFLRGLDTTGTIDPNGASRSVLGTQADTMIQHNHTIAYNGAGSATNKIINTVSDITTSYATYSAQSTTTDIAGSGNTETRPKNIAVSYIIRAL